MTAPLQLDEAAWSHAVERKHGRDAALLHQELVSALRRASNDLARDVLRRLIQDLHCGRYHDHAAKPRDRRRLLIESLRSVPHDGELKAWRKDLLDRLRDGAYSGAA